jgi:hypothetical protein
MKNPNPMFSVMKNLGLGLVLLALPQVVRADEVAATVTSVKGAVSITDASGASVPAVEGSKVPTGDTITTGADGYVGLTLTPGSGTVVAPNTTVKISELDFNKGADGSNNRTINLSLKNGSLLSTLFKKDGHSDFRVTTPYGVAAAKGTTWAVTVQGTALTVDVANGTVTVSNAAGQIIATIPLGKRYNSKTGTLSTLPQHVIDEMLATLQQFLPDLTKAELKNALNGGTINPSTVNDVNSPNQ